MKKNKTVNDPNKLVEKQKFYIFRLKSRRSNKTFLPRAEAKI